MEILKLGLQTIMIGNLLLRIIIKKNAENEINTGLYLRCDIGDSTLTPVFIHR